MGVPTRCEAELLLPPNVSTSLPELAPDHRLNLKRFRLEAGLENVFVVREGKPLQSGTSP